MDTNDLKPYLAVALKQSDAHYKALANFMFREIIRNSRKLIPTTSLIN